MKYDAFISYRHAPLDMEIAKKLHKGLETFPIPAPVQKKTGKKKISRVFRDQEELPIGADLTEKISSAIKESEYLIAVCSKDTPESYWVQKEIETFIEMHDRSHVLAILVDGEPGESFPSMLLTDENGNPVEPLAADVRGETKSERNKKFKTELLRLAAPIIGCSFDDLRQRHRERVIKKTIGIVAAAAALISAAGISFGLYNANVAKEMEMLAAEKAALAEEKTLLANEIMAEYNEKLRNQSRFYASEALSLLDAGDRRAAALVAAEAIATPENERPYVPEGEYALSQALRVYETGFEAGVNRTLHHDLAVASMQRSVDAKYITSIDDGESVYVWDTATWEQKVCIRPRASDTNHLSHIQAADADDSGVYILTTEKLCKYDYDGNEIWHKDKETLGFIDMAVRGESVVVSSTAEYLVLDAQTGAVRHSLESNGIDYFTGRFLYDPDRQFVVCATSDPAVGNTKLQIFDLASEEVKDVELSMKHFLKMFETPDGEIAVLCSDPFSVSENSLAGLRLELYTAGGERLWSVVPDVGIRDPLTAVLVIKAHSYEVDGEMRTRIVYSVENRICSYDAADGSEISSVFLQTDAEEVLLESNGTDAIAGFANGNVDRIDLSTGQLEMQNSVSTVNNFRDMVSCNLSYVVRTAASTELYVVNYMEAPDKEELPQLEAWLMPQGVSASGGYYMMCDINGNGLYRFYDKDGNTIYGFDDITDYQRNVSFIDGKTYLSTKDGIYIIDPIAGTREDIPFSSVGVDDWFSGIRLTPDGSRAVGWLLGDIYVIDLESKSIVTKHSSDSTIGKALISNDGQKVYYTLNDGRLKGFVISDGSEIVFPDEGLNQIADAFGTEFIRLSPDGSYLAMACSDGYVRLVDLSTLQTMQQIPLASHRDFYMEFTSDANILILQGDDRVIRIWDIAGQKYLNTFEVGGFELRYLIEDPEKGRIALCTGYGLSLLDTGTYAKVADVPEGVLYMPEEGCFIQQYRNLMFRTYYKDSAELLSELERQFPGESLSDQEKAVYNID